MLKGRLNGKTLASLIVLLMAVCATAFAGLRDESWDVNPSAYRYDMSLYFDMEGQDFEDMSSFEIGAFVDDECRGLAEKLELPDGGSCLYMRIRSNQAEGEKLSIYLRDKRTGQVVPVRGEDGSELVFKADSRLGLPSEPLMMEPYFTATFKIDGEVIKVLEVGYGDAIEASAAPEKEGYSFNGWADVPATMPGYDIEFHSSYSVNSYMLTFVVEGNELYSGQVPYGSSIIVPEVPAKEGCTFAGWDKEVPATMPAGDLTITGAYDVINYAVVYKIDGEVVYTDNVAFGEPLPAFNDVPEKKGHTFSGWSEIPDVMPAHDVEINGFYNINHYTVTFTLEGETIVSHTLAYGEEIIQPVAPDREGYIFNGWGDVPATMPDRDLAFEGSYSVKTYTATFRIDQEVFQVLTLEYGAEIVAPEAPEKEGHTFSGWGEVPATMPANDLVFVGTYAARYYIIVFKVDDQILKQADLAYGTDIIVPDAPEKEGHSFTGWGEVPETMPAYDLYFNASYTVNSYTLTFKIGDEVVYEGQMNYGAEITAPEAPAKDGNTFSGWGIVPATMPASDLVISGTYIPNTYTLTFLVDGEVHYTTQVAYGSEISAPEAPVKEGYSLTGWDNVPATMPAYDLNINGTFAINSYKLTFKIDDEVIFIGDLNYGTEIVVPEAPVKEGHSFSGWGMVPATMPASDLEITGSYTVNIYNLAFVVDGETIYTTTQAYGSEIVAPFVDVREGYTFSGWTDMPATMPAGDLTVNGTYTTNVYTLTFKVDGEVIYSSEVAYGAEIAAPVAPVKVGHTFNGWGEVPATMPAQNLDFEGSYTTNVYTMIFKIDGETIAENKLAYGDPVAAPEAPAKEGYSFSGWGEVPVTMPDHDMEISGSYSINRYTATFKIGDEVIVAQDLAYGEEIIAPEAAAKEGYTFSGWGEVPAAMPAQDLTFTGSYTVNTYTVTFRIDQEVYQTLTLEYGAEIVAPEAPEQEGHTFSGWGEVPSTMPAHDLVFVGTFADSYYTIIFRIGDEIVKQADLAYGAQIIVPDVPELEGHTFSGWGDVPATMPAQNIEFSGSYAVNTYTLTFKIDDVAVSTNQVAYGSEITAPEAAAKEGYTFSGWGIVPVTMPASDLVISGTYLVNTYTLSFVIDGEVYSTAQVIYGSEIVAPEVADKPGISFSGWGNVPATMPASDLTINGTFSANSYVLTFKIGDEVIFSGTVAYGSDIKAPEAPVREGYTFSGWGEVPATMPDRDLEFNGSYTANIYTLTFKIGDEVISTTTIEYGADIIAPEVAAREGYTFSGWGEVPATMPARDVEISGNYTVNVYTLTFKIGDEVLSATQVAYGTEITAPEAAVREGYTFSGWGVVPATMPASDLTITGSYEVNTYSVVFRIDGEVFYSAQLAYGSEITVPEVPVREGSSFSGWGEVPATMPARDLEFNGTYAADFYTLTFRIGDEVISVSKIAYGAEIVVPEVQAREGYTFSGWGVVPATMPASDLEFTGAYEVNYYNVTFKINGNVAYSAQLPYGAEIVAPEVPAHEGYTFGGWSEYPATVPAYDVEVNGTYTVNTYVLTIYINDAIYMQETLEYGAEIVLHDPEVAEGMKFDGWQEEVPGTMPAHDVDIHGTVSEDTTTWINCVMLNSDVTVYTVGGVLLFENRKAAEIQDRLLPGFYIINGKTMMVR